MNYQTYEDYMRSVLGYPMNSPEIYEPYDYRNSQNYEDTYYRNEYVSNLSEEEIRGLYPEIYHLVYPMVCKVCAVNSQPLTGELIEKMTDEVYNAIEDTSTVVNVRIDAKKEDDELNSKKAENRTVAKTENSRLETRTPIKTENRSELRPERRSEARTENRRTSERESSRESKDNRESRVEKTSTEMQVNEIPRETRQSNFTLRDLIKILILNQLFGGNRPNRPPQRPPHPPFPGGPGMPPRPPTRPPIPGGRPPMMPRTDIQDSMQKNYNDYLTF